MIVKNSYRLKDAKKWQESVGELEADKHLGERIYTSRLIGQIPDLVMHGGGNTSVKVERPNLFGDIEKVLHVKGSGWDLDTIEAAGLPAVRLEPLLKLRSLEELRDEDMVNFQRNNLLDSSSPNPSVETLLHAFLPHKYVDHTHATPFLILANLPKAGDICKEIFGSRLGVVPYIMPGFALAKKAAEVFEKDPTVEGLLLLNHGHFAFGNTGKESYDRIVEHTNQVAKYFNLRQPTDIGKRKAHKYLHILPILRGLIAELNGKEDDSMPIFDLRNGNDVMDFFKRKDLSELEKRGMASPDHVLRTKGRPIFLNQKNERDGIKEKVKDFRSEYIKYFRRQASRTENQKTMLKPDPKHAWLDGIGILGIGVDARAASASADLAEQNLRVRSVAEDFGGFYPLKEKDMFDCEYWSLEQAKLGKGKAPIFQGKIVVVTGGAGTIGLATAKEFSKLGANVLLVDNDQAALDKALTEMSPWDSAISCDITKKDSAEKTMEAALWNFGGIDILISNAGGVTSGSLLELEDDKLRRSFELNFFAHKSFSTEAAKIMKLQRRGGQILFNISKQAINPGNKMGAYGMPKATTMFLMRQLALELGDDGIRVNGLNADRIRSGLLTDSFIRDRAASRGVSEEIYMAGNLLRREVEANHVASGFTALAQLERTTGHVLTVDGGNTAAELR
jgi:rhamnose utilization protein RhaD (predicted bifunctional aldolase and dehydrogenase)/NAD(P)-dependent dehydrogenase (short-subunit alcohol dehydrogenase family)